MTTKLGRPVIVDDGIQISVRVERSLVKRADALKTVQGIPVGRAAVWRAALDIGIAELERRRK